MSSYLNDFSCLFAADMPGVVAVTLPPELNDGYTPATIYAHLWQDQDLVNDGIVTANVSACRLTAPTTAWGDLRRGDEVMIASRVYRCVTNPADDGHGIATVYLEPNANTTSLTPRAPARFDEAWLT